MALSDDETAALLKVVPDGVSRKLPKFCHGKALSTYRLFGQIQGHGDTSGVYPNVVRQALCLPLILFQARDTAVASACVEEMAGMPPGPRWWEGNLLTSAQLSPHPPKVESCLFPVISLLTHTHAHSASQFQPFPVPRNGWKSCLRPRKKPASSLP